MKRATSERNWYSMKDEVVTSTFVAYDTYFDICLTRVTVESAGAVGAEASVEVSVEGEATGSTAAGAVESTGVAGTST